MAQAPGDNVDSPKDFAHAFGDALKEFLADKEIGQSDAARKLGLAGRGGARLNAYFHDRANRTRPKPDAELLYLLCTKLDFSFEYNGYKISAATLNGRGKTATAKPQQIVFSFDRQFSLSDEDGTAAASVKRPAERIEVSVSLKAAG